MKIYLHHTLELSHREGARVFFVRRSILKPALLGGLAVLLLGLWGLAHQLSENSAQDVKLTGALLLLLAGLVASSPGAERVEIDTAQRLVKTADGKKIRFESIRRLEIQQTTDSEESPAYRLRLDTTEGPSPLSRTFCWTEAAVRAVAQQILREIPGLSLSPNTVVSDD